MLLSKHNILIFKLKMHKIRLHLFFNILWLFGSSIHRDSSRQYVKYITRLCIRWLLWTILFTNRHKRNGNTFLKYKYRRIFVVETFNSIFTHLKFVIDSILINQNNKIIFLGTKCTSAKRFKSLNRSHRSQSVKVSVSGTLKKRIWMNEWMNEERRTNWIACWWIESENVNFSF